MTTALVFTFIVVILVVGVAVAVFLTEGDDGAVHKPHWPARYPPPQHRAPKTARGIYGDFRAHLREDGSEPARHAEVKR